MTMLKSSWAAVVALIGNNILVSIMTGIVNAIRGLWNGLSLKEIAVNLMQGIINGIQSQIAAVKSAWQSVTALFKSAPSNKTPAMPSNMRGYSSGGYTGNGGRNAVAGIVHRGEGVLNQAEINSIGGESGFNRLRGLIRTWGSRGISMLAGGGLGQVKSGGLISRGLALLDGSSSQERPKFRDAISVNAAMATAGGAAPSAAGMGNFSVTIHIHGGNDNAETIAATVERKFREMKAEFERKNKTSFWDKD